MSTHQDAHNMTGQGPKQALLRATRTPFQPILFCESMKTLEKNERRSPDLDQKAIIRLPLS